MNAVSACPELAVLESWFDAQVDGPSSPISQHVAKCPTCAATIAEWARLRALVREIPTATSIPPAPVFPRQRRGVPLIGLVAAAAAVITVVLLIRPRGPDGLVTALHDARATLQATRAELEGMSPDPRSAAVREIALDQLREDSLLILRVADQLDGSRDD